MLMISENFLAWEYLDQGVKLMQASRFEEAILSFDEALKYLPDDARSHWNKAISLLTIGNYVQGFAELEWRWKLFDWCWGHLDRDIYRIETVPVWNGEDIVNKNLLLYHEQGFGDAIMMARYISELQKLGARITLLTVPALTRLMAFNFTVEVIEKLPPDLTRFDYRCAQFGPMRILEQTVLTIPKPPYLSCDALQPVENTIGVVWSGVTQKALKCGQFLEKLDYRGFDLQALQFGSVPENVKPLDNGYDFLDTLALIEKLQHIVTVDTAVAHLAGARGHPSVHVLLPPIPDWRWWHGYAWYPNLNLHRDWESLNKALH